MAKIDAMTEAIEWLEDKANESRNLGQECPSFAQIGESICYLLEAERWQGIADWLKEYREILQEREVK